MQHDINPDGSRNKSYRPYIFGEQKVWDDSMYDPFRSVDFGLYSNPSWTSVCHDQHNCFDRLAPKSHKHNVREYENRVHNYNQKLSRPADYSAWEKQSFKPQIRSDKAIPPLYKSFGANDGVLYRRLDSM